MKLQVINGVNLNLLGEREPGVYGNKTLSDINAEIAAFCKSRGVEVDFYQSNIEGEICEKIQSAKCDGIILNAGAYSHYSIAIRDAITASRKKVVEVHISNVFAREEFRHTSVIAPVCAGLITGFKEKSYLLAVESFLV